ncbi:MAG TPA: hypothetical protein VMR70_01080 [Flavisolibacter sp.]|nr:hypothetical protein [Flavisolibacter sp.]
MSYAVEKWDRLISSTLHPDNLPNFSANAETIQLFLDQSETDRDKVRKQLIRQAFSTSKEKAVEHFVQQHQGILIRLLDKIHHYRQVPELDGTIASLYEAIEGHLQEILGFIEHYFTKYFNLDERVPVSYLNISKEELCQQLPTCKQILGQRYDADKKLIGILCSYIQDFCSDGFMAYTYRDLIYHKELVQQLISLGTNGRTEHHYSALREVLIYLNFNSPLFIDYFTSQIHEELGSLPDNPSKIEHLAFHQKKIGQMQLKPGFSLHSEFPTVRETLLEVLDREIEYLTTIKVKVTAAPAQSVIELPDRTSVRETVTVPFRVPEIYLLNKSFIDAGGAPTETYKSLLEKVAPSLANKNQRGFSVESLQKASDKVNPEAKENVKRFLQRMIRNIDSYD